MSPSKSIIPSSFPSESPSKSIAPSDVPSGAPSVSHVPSKGPSAGPTVLFLNEVHYRYGGCSLCQFTEIAYTTGLDKSNFSVSYYNSTGYPFMTAQGSDFIGSETSGGLTFAFKLGVVIDPAGGLALIKGTTVLQFVTFFPYEFVAQSGSAAGMTAEVIGFDNLTSTTSLQLQGTGCKYSDFSWDLFPRPESRGAPNTGTADGQLISGC